MEPRHRAALTAAIDRIIPADDFPSASENNVGVFIDRLTTTDLHTWRGPLCAGLDALDQAALETEGRAFSELNAERQDTILRSFERDPVHAEWFRTLVRVTNEGYYTDASRGSNLRHVSWKMIGYDPRLPREAE